MIKNMKFFGALPDGTEAEEYTYKNGDLEVSVCNYGAIITHIKFQGHEMVLGYDSVAGYAGANGSYLGAFVGRYANRIAGGKFVLNGHEYNVGANEASTGSHLHGGGRGFDKRLYTVNRRGCSTIFSRMSPNGEEGYPGNLLYSVAYRVLENSLVITYRATCDTDTILNLTNHSYFNPGTLGAGKLMLRVNADCFTPVDEHMIPTGELMSVDGTPFDFRRERRISDALCSRHPQIEICGGIDHNFVLGSPGCMKKAATLYSPETGYAIDCFTDMPGIQVYTANFLCEKAGRGGISLKKRTAVCLETQYYPDTPNHSDFPSCVLKAGEEFVSVTKYRFRKV